MKKICKMHKHERDHKGLNKAGAMSEPLGRPKSGGAMRAGHPSKGLLGTSSGMGASIRGEGEKTGEPNLGRAKKEATESLAAQRAMPKPNLTKACSMHKAEFAKHSCALHKSEEQSVPETNEREGMQDPKDNDDCPYCAENENNRTDDCQMCQDLDAVDNAYGTAGMTDDCPACKEIDEDKGIATDDNCPYCDDVTIEQANPEQAEIGGNTQTQACNCPNCPPDNNHLSPDQQGVAADDAYPSTNGPDDCPECQQLYGDAVEEQPGQTGQEPPKTQGHETAAEVLDMLNQEPGTGTPPTEEAKQIDNTEMPQGDQMEEGTSVPENFGDAQKNDISDEEKSFGGDSQDQPDMASVMQSGLDDHANEQKRAEVIDQVAQTLQGFKANKEFLEAAKEQSPGLYQSTIQMLKSMIALCELLGLKPEMTPEQPQQEMPPKAAPAAAAPQPNPSAEGQPDPKAAG